MVDLPHDGLDAWDAREDREPSHALEHGEQHHPAIGSLRQGSIRREDVHLLQGILAIEIRIARRHHGIVHRQPLDQAVGITPRHPIAPAGAEGAIAVIQHDVSASARGIVHGPSVPAPPSPSGGSGLSPRYMI